MKTLGVSQTRREGAFSFSWWFLAACYCLLIGVTFDSWAHNHLARLETFFTPWHAILYAGVLATGLVLPGAILLQRMRGGSWKHVIPDGYELAVLGVVGSVIGGLLDMIWHILFGIESNIDAAFSPTHILIMVTFGLTLAGPYRALYTSARPTPRSMLLLSFTLLLTYWSLISQTAHPYTSLWLSTTPKTDEQGQILAIVSYVVQGCFLAAVTMYTIRRWKLFFGFFTLALTASAIPLSTMQDIPLVIPIGLASGLLIDGAYLIIKPSLARQELFRLFVALVPGLWLLTYNISLALVYGTVWSIHLLIGSVVVVCLIAWLLSGLMVPFPLPAEAGDEGV